jgi:hypothetical protein
MKLHRRVDRAVVPWLGRILARLGSLGETRWRLRLFTGLALSGSIGVLVTVVWASRTRAPDDREGVAGLKVHVGVAQGQSIPNYVASSRRELKALLSAGHEAPKETYALVSLRSYLAPDRLIPVLGAVAVAEVYARVPLPDTQTQIVRIPALRISEDVVSGMRQMAERKDTEAEEYRLLAAKLNEVNAAEDRLRQTYLGGATLAGAEATAYRNACSCVYAAVVRATPAALDQIAARPEVRAVDPAPEVLRLDQAIFLAPLPEQRDGMQPAPSVSVRPSPVPARSAQPSPSASPSVDPSPSVGSASPSGSPTRAL